MRTTKCLSVARTADGDVLMLRVETGPLVAVLASSALVLAGFAHSHDGEEGHSHEKVRKVENAEVYAPTPIPDRIILTWSGDPTTTQSVSWRTSVETQHAKAQIAIATAGPEFVKKATEVVATSVALKTDLNTAHLHSVAFKDLTPGTKYA